MAVFCCVENKTYFFFSSGMKNVAMKQIATATSAICHRSARRKIGARGLKRTAIAIKSHISGWNFVRRATTIAAPTTIQFMIWKYANGRSAMSAPRTAKLAMTESQCVPSHCVTFSFIRLIYYTIDTVVF